VSLVRIETKIETKGLLFDMDGVLISSIGSVERSWRKWAAIYGIPNAESYQVPHGMRAVDIVKSLRPDIDPIEGLRVIEAIEVEDLDDVKVLPGARALLKSLPHERWTIVTSATRRIALTRLQAAGLPAPEKIISADMVERGKPHPEPYLRGAELLGAKPEECVVVEDAPSGIGAGLAARSRVLGVLGTHTLKQLHKAEWVVRSLEDVTVIANAHGLELQFENLKS